MLRLLADENFNGAVVRGLVLRSRLIDLARAQDVGLLGSLDEDVLEWAADNDCIVLTHDRKTMPGFAYERVAAGNPMPGVFVFNNKLPVGQAIEEIVLLDECSETEEWGDQVVYMPL